MYDDFTNRACVVMQLASQEARRFNHDQVGTEHILLGIVNEGVRTQARPGVAARVLKEFGVLDLRKIRVEVEKIVHSGTDIVREGELPRNPQAEKVIDHAVGEARNLDLPDIGTGFLLLGRLHEPDGVAAQVFKGLGLDLDDIRNKVLQLLGK
jgi:ATP-dependent Clp protease ATP-binding subunit ClpC